MTDEPEPPATSLASLGLERAQIEAAALTYLGRYSASRSGVRQVLQRRIARALRPPRGTPAPQVDREALQATVEAVLDRVAALGYLNDATFAEGLATRLRGQGRSRRAVQHALANKGVTGEVAQAALAEVDEGEADPELTAARRFAQKKRLGPFHRDASQRALRRERDLGAMARAGFGFSLARKVIDGPADLDDED